MTGQGLLQAFRFVRFIALAFAAMLLAHWNPVVIAIASAAAVLLTGAELSRNRRDTGGPTQSTPSAWWLGILIPFGLGVWGTFLYIGVRTRRWEWLAWSFAYLSMIVLGGFLNALGDDRDPMLSATAGILWLVAWVGGALHARWIHGQVRTALAQSSGVSQG